MTASYPRGTVLKCNFPYDTSPHKPGPQPHYCLVIDSEYEFDGKQYVAVCYGTSRLDEALVSSHQGLILSISSTFVKGGPMPGPVTHFLADHVALLPVDSNWVYSNFRARLDFMREEVRAKDHIRGRLYKDFLALERTMLQAATEVIQTFITTGALGLPKQKRLRKKPAR